MASRDGGQKGAARGAPGGWRAAWRWCTGAGLAALACGHGALLALWRQPSDGSIVFEGAAATAAPLAAGGGGPAGAPTGDDDDDDDEDVGAVLDEILASRGEARIRRPLADLEAPAEDHCSGFLPLGGHGGEASGARGEVEAQLARLFQHASGFWAAGAAEVAAVASAYGGGEPAACAEATYGEISVAGLEDVLHGLAQAGAGAPLPFEALLDLGAGVGRTAAAGAMLGLARLAFGVELGPERFALGCRAMAALGPGLGAVPRLELLRGDARAWPELAAEHRWPRCGPGWALYLGAKCFRDTLLASVAEAIRRGCAPGARVAVLGRRLPPEAAAQGPVLRGLGSLHAATTWADRSEVHLYELAAA